MGPSRRAMALLLLLPALAVAQPNEADWLDSLFDGETRKDSASNDSPNNVPAAVTLPPDAVARSAPAPRRQLEEIVVTARRREEGLQDTPVAITALPGDDLADLGITTLADIKTVTPSLQFASSLEKSPSIFIRGVGQRSASFALDPGVGLYLNGIYIPRQDTQLLDAVDVASIQVLRGPQGTLFGKNNIGGALLVDTLRPDPAQFSAAATWSIGDFGRGNQRYSLNLPLLDDRLAARLAFDSKRLDGFIRNADGGPDLLDEDRWGLSGRLLWQASDRLEVDLFGYLSSTNERGLPVSCRLQDSEAIVQQLLYRDDAFPSAADACRASEALAGQAVRQTAGAVVYAIDNHLAALTLRFDAGWGEWQSITSWALQDNFARGTDPDGAATAAIQGGSVATRRIVGGSVDIPEEVRDQFSQELKLNLSALADRLDLTAGLFLAREGLDNAVFGANIGDEGLAGVTLQAAASQFLSGGPLAAALAVPAELLGQEAVVLPFFGNFDYVSDLLNETYAVFAQGSWRLAEQWELTAGGRYTVEQRYRNVRSYVADFGAYANALNAQIGSDPAILLPVTHLDGGIFSPVSQAQFLAYDAPAAAYGPPDLFEGRVRFGRLTPNAVVSYQVGDSLLARWRLDRLLAYLTYSEGFKSGGLEIRGISALSRFEPEVVRSTELGVKLEALDGRLRLNSALYLLDYSNLQVELAEAGEGLVSTVLFLDNAGRARVSGVELEATALLGAWTLQATLAHTRGEYQDYTLLTNTSDGVRPVDRSGEPFALVPENTASLVLQYLWDSSLGELTPLLQLYYRDELFTGLDFAAIQFPSSTIAAQTVANARLSWQTPWRLRLTAYLNNLTDGRYFVGGAAVSDQIGVATLQPAPPRHYGLEIGYRF